jgi:hypothetical protein
VDYPLQLTGKYLEKNNAPWLSIPADHNLTPKYKQYGEVSQCHGKEMKEMSRNLL